MRQAKHGDTVKIHYTGKLEDETVFDSSVNREPLQFTIGAGKIIPGVEQGIIGMSPGESKTMKVSSDKAYGPHRPELVEEIERKKLPNYLKLEAGKMLQIQQPNGQTIRVLITDVTESKVTLDGNHPLAGKELIFDIQLLEIK
ncbi:MAG: peptidylprolyl isomerase [candidate division WOR-3 bacterium]|nr:MAG: peptidylprolyl isomerase [candidate division WOR-3 bacterium]